MPNGEAVSRAVAALQAGMVVAAPTESSFGLLVDITNARALDLLLSLKPRGADKGQPLMVPDFESFARLARHIPTFGKVLAERFWPGQLTLVVEAAAGLDPRVTLEGRVAVRVPGASLAADVSRAHGAPLSATSANPPGEPPALTADQLGKLFPEAIRAGTLVVLGDQAPGGAPSTLVGFAEDSYQVLREGAIPASSIQRALNS